MKILLLQIADCANVTGDGKLNIMGLFSEINAQTFPARHPSMHLIVKLGAEFGEDGQTRTLVIILRDPDGNEILNLSGPLEIPKGQGGRRPEVNAILELKDLVFPKPGPYQFVVHVDMDYKGDLTIYANQTATLNAEKS